MLAASSNHMVDGQYVFILHCRDHLDTASDRALLTPVLSSQTQ